MGTLMVKGAKARRYESTKGIFPFALSAFFLILLLFPCCKETEEEEIENPVEDELLKTWKAPEYLDYYVALADWSYRGRWTLANVHDPTVMKADDGYYYMYQTDASYGNVHAGHGHFHARRSQNLVDWEYLGATMNNPPDWIKTKLNEYRAAMGLEPIAEPVYGYWAPTARKIKAGLYRMYYSIPVDNYIKTGAANTTANFDGSWTERAFIGVMETSDPASNVWTDKGFVICSSSDKNLSYSRPSANNWDAYFRWNAIDPSLVITPNGEHWLFYGSWHSGIVALQLNPETGKPLNALGQPWGTDADISAYGSIVATRNTSSRWQGSEAPEIVYRNGYYYLFLAYDALDVAYNTRVVRSESITGPYKGSDGRDVTTSGGEAFPVVTHPYKFSGSDGWVGISHCAVFNDGGDNWYFSSQGRFPANVNGNAYSNALMLGQIRSIRWTKDGWPLVMPERYAAVPKVPIEEQELAGDWQLIDLSYDYGKQKVATTITLTAGRKVSSGLWQGSGWTFDAGNAILTINEIDLYLQREADWEANPRCHTIVFAGYGANNKTWWGKKTTNH
jgi:beta-xylosidase